MSRGPRAAGRSTSSLRARVPRAGLSTSSSEKLQHWMSLSSVQSAPAILAPSHAPPTPHPPSANGYPPHPAHVGSQMGRHTRTSLLRIRTRSAAYVEVDYGELAKRKKRFAQRCRSVTTSAVMTGKIPEGESMHSFLTGARYNSAHHIDSRSLERLGLYVPRGEPSRTFVNSAGTTPPSAQIYGTKRYSGACRVSGTREMQEEFSHRVLSDLGVYGYRPGSGVSELEEVFGPDTGGASPDSGSVMALCEEDEIGGSHVTVATDISDQQPPTTETFGGNTAQALEGRGSLLPLETTASRDSEDSGSGVAQGEQISHTSVDGQELVLSEQVTEGSEVISQQLSHTTSAESAENEFGDSVQDCLSPAAQRLTAEILKESHSSLSSIESSLEGGSSWGRDKVKSPTHQEEFSCLPPGQGVGVAHHGTMEDVSAPPHKTGDHGEPTDCPPHSSSAIFVEVTVPSAPSDNGSASTCSDDH